MIDSGYYNESARVPGHIDRLSHYLVSQMTVKVKQSWKRKKMQDGRVLVIIVGTKTKIKGLIIYRQLRVEI